MKKVRKDSAQFSGKFSLKALRRNSGMSLVEVLIALGIMSVLVFSMTSLMVGQGRETKALSQKLDTLSLEKLLITTLSDGAVCTFEMTDGTPQTFNSTDINAEITLNQVHASANATAPTIVAVGQNYSSLKIQGIKVTKIVSSGNPDEWLANFEISFDAAQLVRSLKAIALPFIFRTTGPANNKTVTNCASSASSQMSRTLFYYGPGVNTSGVYYCNPTCTWRVPLDVKGPAFVSIAGGGASTEGPKIINSNAGGNSGGYLMSAPVTLVPGALITIKVGAGGQFVNDPAFITGSPGSETSFGSYITCSGGGAPEQVILTSATMTSLFSYGQNGYINGIANGADPTVPGATVVAAKPSLGIYGTAFQGSCGTNSYGLGNQGTRTFGGGSGSYSGGSTPFGYGGGGDDASMHAQFNASGSGIEAYPYPSNHPGVMKVPSNGRNGIVMVDMLR